MMSRENILSTSREMINASQRVDFLRDCDLAPKTWGAGRSDSPGCDLNSRKGAAIGCLSVWEACRLSWTFNPVWESKGFFLTQGA